MPHRDSSKSDFSQSSCSSYQCRCGAQGAGDWYNKKSGLKPSALLRDVPLYRLCSFFLHCSKSLTPPPLPFEHLVYFFWWTDTLHYSNIIGQNKAKIWENYVKYTLKSKQFYPERVFLRQFTRQCFLQNNVEGWVGRFWPSCVSKVWNKLRPFWEDFRPKNSPLLSRVVIFPELRGTLPPERTQPQKFFTANFSSGTLKTHKNGPLRLKNKFISRLLFAKRPKTCPGGRKLFGPFLSKGWLNL